LRSRSQAPAVNLVGLELAGVWTYFASAMAGDHLNLAVDLARFAADSDSEYLNRFYIPGLRQAGDFRAAARLNARGRTLIVNTGAEFPADWARQTASIAGAKLDMHTGEVSGNDLAAWLVRPR